MIPSSSSATDSSASQIFSPVEATPAIWQRSTMIPITHHLKCLDLDNLSAVGSVKFVAYRTMCLALACVFFYIICSNLSFTRASCIIQNLWYSETHTHTHTHAHAHAQIHTHKYTHINTYTYKYTYTNTHT